jgi:phage terminase large subunit-like protein
MSELSKTLANQIRAKSSTLVKSKLSMIDWGKLYVPHFFFRSGCQFHRDLGDTLDAMAIQRGQKVLVLAPRGNAKSTICSMTAPLKFVCEATEKYILIISDTADQAKKYLQY